MFSTILGTKFNVDFNINYATMLNKGNNINLKGGFYMGKVICVNNNKGGVLKTTTATNLAGVIADRQKKVLLIDTDNQANVAITFGVKPEELRTSVFDVLVSGLPAEDAIINVHKYIDILPANRDLMDFEFKVIGNIKKYPEPFYLLHDALEHVKDNYDYIIIDTPPSLGLMNANVFTFSDGVIVPFAPELFSMRSLVEVIRTIENFKNEYNPELQIYGILRTLVDGRTNLHSDIIQETNQFANKKGIHVFDTIITETVQFSNAVAYHKIPATLLPKRKRDKATLYFDLWNELEKFFERVEA